MGTNEPEKGTIHPRNKTGTVSKAQGTTDPAKGTHHPAPSSSSGTGSPTKGRPYPKDFIAVDFGYADALALHGSGGPMPKPKLPRVPGGKSVADDFTLVLPLLLERAAVVVESPTIGSSGVEPARVAEIVAATPNQVWVISARAVKNYRRDHALTWRKGARYAKDGATPPPQAILGIPLGQIIQIEEQAEVHPEDAEIIYRIATEHPRRVKAWKPPAALGPRLVRSHTSVRPHDKRSYRGIEPDRYMARFPAFPLLPTDLQELLGNGVGTKKAGYSRSKAMPFAMALDEDGANTRSGYERVLGLYDHGYPSFYRRATIVLLHANAKRLAGTPKIGNVSPLIRKEAWLVTRKQIRHIYHLIS